MDENYSFNEFSNITDIKCKIHYAFSLNNLKNLGHFYPKEELFLKQLLKLQNKFLIKKGNLWKGKKEIREITREENIQAETLDGKKRLWKI